MTIRERIKRISDKAKVPYAQIHILLNSHIGKSDMLFEDKIKLLEQQYNIK